MGASVRLAIYSVGPNQFDNNENTDSFTRYALCGVPDLLWSACRLGPQNDRWLFIDKKCYFMRHYSSGWVCCIAFNSVPSNLSWQIYANVHGFVSRFFGIIGGFVVDSSLKIAIRFARAWVAARLKGDRTRPLLAASCGLYTIERY